MLLSEQLQKDIETGETYHIAKMELLKLLKDKLPKQLLEYEWESVSSTPYATGWSALCLNLSREDPSNTATIAAWLISLFDDIKVSKPQWSKWRNSAYIEATVMLDDRELRISIYYYKTGQCKLALVIEKLIDSGEK